MSESYRVLVIEDDPDVALFTKTVLEKRANCAVVWIADAQLARATVEEFDPDVVLTDIELPGKTGLEIIASLRAERPTLPFVVMTAHTSANYEASAMRAQADEFLTKPIAASDLIAAITRLAADSRAKREGVQRSKVVLAIGAHPDDAVIGAGGILAAHHAAGDRIIMLTLSAGARGRDVLERQREALDAAELLGAKLVFEDLLDAELAQVAPVATVIDRVVRQFGPTVVYTHSLHDSQPVHRVVHEATLDSTRGVNVVAAFQSPSSTIDFRPTRFESIDGLTDQKLAVLRCFGAVAGVHATPEPEAVLETARYWGRYGDGTSVEPLEIIREPSA